MTEIQPPESSIFARITMQAQAYKIKFYDAKIPWITFDGGEYYVAHNVLVYSPAVGGPVPFALRAADASDADGNLIVVGRLEKPVFWKHSEPGREDRVSLGIRANIGNDEGFYTFYIGDYGQNRVFKMWEKLLKAWVIEREQRGYANSKEEEPSLRF